MLASNIIKFHWKDFSCFEPWGTTVNTAITGTWFEPWGTTVNTAITGTWFEPWGTTVNTAITWFALCSVYLYQPV